MDATPPVVILRDFTFFPRFLSLFLLVLVLLSLHIYLSPHLCESWDLSFIPRTLASEELQPYLEASPSGDPFFPQIFQSDPRLWLGLCLCPPFSRICTLRVNPSLCSFSILNAALPVRLAPFFAAGLFFPRLFWVILPHAPPFS